MMDPRYGAAFAKAEALVLVIVAAVAFAVGACTAAIALKGCSTYQVTIEKVQPESERSP